MNINFIQTNEYYRRILDCQDDGERTKLYLELFVEPWKQMMNMVRGHATQYGPDDELAGARAWAWLLPDQVDAIARLLDKLEAADAWTIGRDALAKAADRFGPYANNVPFTNVSGWMVLADPHYANPLERGYTGATDWFQPRLIGQIWDPTPYVLERLPALVAHEFHHLVRLRAFPFGMNTSVADYIIIEGTAEAFAASLFGEDKIGYFITEVDQDNLETARRLIGQGLHETGFDVIRGYIFGDALAERASFRPVGGMPTYGGYAVGYHVVRAYLERTGKSIEETTFIPADEIVRMSGFFESEN